MERLGGEDRGQTASIRQVALASLLGTTIEWYDFFIYVTAASFVFNRLFSRNSSLSWAHYSPTRPTRLPSRLGL